MIRTELSDVLIIPFLNPFTLLLHGSDNKLKYTSVGLKIFCGIGV